MAILNRLGWNPPKSKLIWSSKSWRRRKRCTSLILPARRRRRDLVKVPIWISFRTLLLRQVGLSRVMPSYKIRQTNTAKQAPAPGLARIDQGKVRTTQMSHTSLWCFYSKTNQSPRHSQKPVYSWTPERWLTIEAILDIIVLVGQRH